MRTGFGELIAQFYGCRPMNGVGYDFSHVFVVVRTAVFVSGLEVEDFAETSLIAYTASEHKSVLVPASEYERIGCGNIKRLTVKLFKLKRKVVGNSLRYGVYGIEIPDDFFLVASPGKVTRRSYNVLKYL